jgi:hypothetical protein
MVAASTNVRGSDLDRNPCFAGCASCTSSSPFVRGFYPIRQSGVSSEQDGSHADYDRRSPLALTLRRRCQKKRRVSNEEVLWTSLFSRRERSGAGQNVLLGLRCPQIEIEPVTAPDWSLPLTMVASCFEFPREVGLDSGRLVSSGINEGLSVDQKRVCVLIGQQTLLSRSSPLGGDYDKSKCSLLADAVRSMRYRRVAHGAPWCGVARAAQM